MSDAKRKPAVAISIEVDVATFHERERVESEFGPTEMYDADKHDISKSRQERRSFSGFPTFGYMVVTLDEEVVV